MISYPGGNVYTFSSSAASAVKSVKRLVEGCLVQAAAAPETTAGHTPVAELRVSSFDTDNGAIFFPRWEIVDWVQTGQVLHSLAKTGQAAQFGVSNEAALNEDLGEELTPENTEPKKSKRRM
jgi:hypothetical protein